MRGSIPRLRTGSGIFPGDQAEGSSTAKGRQKGCMPQPLLIPIPALTFRRCLGGEHVVDRIGEIIHSGHGNDDDIAMPLAVFGDAEETAASVFAQIDREKLPLDLQLS